MRVTLGLTFFRPIAERSGFIVEVKNDTPNVNLSRPRILRRLRPRPSW
jgi:hypothetical protein